MAPDEAGEGAVGIFLLDDEPDVMRATCWLLASVGLKAAALTDPALFIAALQGYAGPALVVLDLRMPGTSGLAVMEQIRERRPDVPVTFLSAHGDVPTAVRSMKLGAVDFLQKPFDPDSFLDCINRSMRLARARHRDHLARVLRERRMATLSRRERQVFDRMVQGASSKAIGRALAISPKTADVHRANVLRKLEASSMHELLTYTQAARTGAEPPAFASHRQD